jgi:hypothetical protein
MTPTGHAPRWATALAALALVGCTGDTPTSSEIAAPDQAALSASQASVHQTLAELRARTASWHNRAIAEADGYTVDVGCSDERTLGLSASEARGMGYHTANLDILLDDHSTVLEPELIVYSLDAESGQLRMAGFDYFIPGDFYPGPSSPDYPGSPPTLEGTGLEMGWSEAHGGWVQHIWPWMHNPDGMFENFNPAVPLCECLISPDSPLCTPG